MKWKILFPLTNWWVNKTGSFNGFIFYIDILLWISVLTIILRFLYGIAK